jgi:hypothetical protein
MTNSWFSESVEGVRYFLETFQDLIFSLQEQVGK